MKRSSMQLCLEEKLAIKEGFLEEGCVGLGWGLVKGKSACTEDPGQDMVREPQDSLLGEE